MAILKILARTGVLFVCSIIQVVGVIAEGAARLLGTLAEYLVILDDKLIRKVEKKKEKKTEEVPT